MGNNTDDSARNPFGFYTPPRVKETGDISDVTDATLGSVYSEIISPVNECIATVAKAVSFNPGGKDNTDAVEVLRELNTKVERAALNQPVLTTKAERMFGVAEPTEKPSAEQPSHEERGFKLSS
ncbi:TPA: phosphoesterase [Legionella pneumophila]|nr:phosphoesterase [Legionella pneumophila]HAT8181879.1 phosphoesterase [Legionella pneumophila]